MFLLVSARVTITCLICSMPCVIYILEVLHGKLLMTCVPILHGEFIFCSITMACLSSHPMSQSQILIFLPSMPVCQVVAWYISATTSSAVFLLPLASYQSLLNYTNILKHINNALGADLSFMSDYDCSFTQRGLRRVMGDRISHTFPITVDIYDRARENVP